MTEALRGNVRVIITGPDGLESRVAFAIVEESSEIARWVRETIDD